MRHCANAFSAAFAVLFLFLGTSEAFAAPLKIGSAKYDAKKGELKVSGAYGGAAPGTAYTLFNADSGDLLANVTAGPAYQLKVTDFGLRRPPCNVRVQAGPASAVAAVKGAPPDCGEFVDEDLAETVTLAGVVRDAPIPYATVTVTVGGLTFTTVADENGEFVIEIAGIDLTSLVLIETTGTNPSDETATVDMASIAGTLEKLLEDADGDGIVDGTENPNINNTPYTTALFVLVGEANGGEIPDTLEELQEAERSVDATELLQLAAVIKLIVDEGYQMPIDPSTGQPYETIIGFLADAEVDGGGNTPVENFIADNNEAVETAVEVILTDNDIVPAFVEAEIPDRYYWLLPAQVGFLSRHGRAFDFVDTPAKTGEIRAVSGSGDGAIIPGEFTWGVNGGKLELDWTVQPQSTFGLYNPPLTPPELTLRCRAPDDPQFASCPHTCQEYIDAWDARVDPDAGITATGTTTHTELTKYAVSAGGTREFASETDIVAVEYAPLTVDYDGPGPNDPPVSFEFCDEIEAETINVELLNVETNPPKPLAVPDFAGDTVAMPIIYDPDGIGDLPESLFFDFVTFNDDPDVGGWRSTTTLLSGANPDWRIANGNELQFDYGGGIVQTQKQLEPTLDLETAFWVEVNGVPQPYGLYNITLRADPTFQFTVPYLVNDTGEFWNAVILNAWRKDLWQTNALGQFELLPGQSFGWEFTSSDSSPEVDPSYLYGFNYFSFPISWRIETASFTAGLGQLANLPAGTLTLHRWNGAQTALRQKRYWIPIAETLVSQPADVAHAETPRKRFYVIEQFYLPDGTMQVAPRINAEEVFDKTVLN